MPILRSLLDNVLNIPQRIAIQYKGKAISYKKLGELINKMGQRLYSPIQYKNEKILILLPNCPEFIISYFAITSIGKIAVLADINFTEELAQIVRENNIRRIIIKEQMIEKTRDILYRVEAGAGIAEDMEFIIADYLIDELNLMGENEKSEASEVLSQNDVDMILYTSGSLNRPKGVITSHSNIEEAVKNYSETLPIKQCDKLVAVIPFFHSYAFGSCMMAGLAGGATLLLLDNFMPSKVLKLIVDEKATIFHGVPYMYKHLNNRLEKGIYNVESLRFCICAGAVLGEDISKQFYQLTKKVIHQEYGSTETGTIALNLNEELEKNINSVGKPLRNVEIRIDKSIGEETGIIHIKSKAVSLGYIGKESVFANWYNTGDIGRVDSDNYIYLVGREKRMINIAGKKVNPSEIETVLLKHSDIVEALVKGVILNSQEETIEAIIVRRNDTISKDDIKKFCQMHLAPYKVPRIINWVDSIPKSSLGKNKLDMDTK